MPAALGYALGSQGGNKKSSTSNVTNNYSTPAVKAEATSTEGTEATETATPTNPSPLSIPKKDSSTVPTSNTINY